MPTMRSMARLGFGAAALAFAAIVAGCQSQQARPQPMSEAKILPAHFDAIPEVQQASVAQFQALDVLRTAYTSVELDEKIAAFDQAIAYLALAERHYEAAILRLPVHLRPILENEIESVHRILTDVYRHRPIEACLRKTSRWANNPMAWDSGPIPVADPNAR